MNSQPSYFTHTFVAPYKSVTAPLQRGEPVTKLQDLTKVSSHSKYTWIYRNQNRLYQQYWLLKHPSTAAIDLVSIVGAIYRIRDIAYPYR